MMALLLVAAGFLVLTIGGWLACSRFDSFVRKQWSVPKPRFRETKGEIPPELTGLVERLFFSGLVAVDAGGYAPAMIAWLAVKLAASWTWPELEKDKDDTDFGSAHAAYHSMRKSRIVSLLTGIISLGCALAAGLLFRCALR